MRRSDDPNTCWPTRPAGQTLPRPLRERYADLVTPETWATVDRAIAKHLSNLDAIVELHAEQERQRQLAIVHRPPHAYTPRLWL